VGDVSANVVYKGRSGCCSGIDQIVFEVPAGVEGCYVPLIVKTGNVVSNFTTLAVASSGNACEDEHGLGSGDVLSAETGGGLRMAHINLFRY
ncbi:MAG: hypothetical protein GY926_01730, partial [bacterium]|nr:hypothetical protein [bacterium]